MALSAARAAQVFVRLCTVLAVCGAVAAGSAACSERTGPAAAWAAVNVAVAAFIVVTALYMCRLPGAVAVVVAAALGGAALGLAADGVTTWRVVTLGSAAPAVFFGFVGLPVAAYGLAVWLLRFLGPRHSSV
jgi:hypothetical protein